MIGQKIKIDQIYEYQIVGIKEGGMGDVLIMDRVSDVDRFTELVMNQSNLGEKFSFIYQRKLAAKTFKDNDFVELNKSVFEEK